MIKLQSISKSFDGVSVLENISAEIPDSGIFAICGTSGSGKTTLMRIILGLEQPDSGNIYGLEGKKRQSSFKTTVCSRGSVRSTMSPPCAQRSAQKSCSKRLSFRTHSTKSPPSSAAECAAGWRWRGRWRLTRTYSCSTSRLKASTPSCAGGR